MTHMNSNADRHWPQHPTALDCKESVRKGMRGELGTHNATMGEPKMPQLVLDGPVATSIAKANADIAAALGITPEAHRIMMLSGGGDCGYRIGSAIGDMVFKPTPVPDPPSAEIEVTEEMRYAASFVPYAWKLGARNSMKR